jgi:mycothiol S-conjugate amidase
MHRLTLLVVNGHPDDETESAGGVLARYAAEGVRVICVTATRGELGDIAVKELATPENRARLGDLREVELRRAVAVLGRIEVRFLGYRDSGADRDVEQADARSFARADLDEAAGRVVGLIREYQADVIIAPNGYGGDGHLDHIMASRIARIAFERAGDPDAYPEGLHESGLMPWTPSKLYEPVIQYGRRAKLERALRTGDLSGALKMSLRVARHWRPTDERQRREAAHLQHSPTTRVDVSDYLGLKYAALREFRTQIAPDSHHFNLTVDERREVSPTEDFSLRSTRVPATVPEDDLFAGLRGMRLDAGYDVIRYADLH